MNSVIPKEFECIETVDSLAESNLFVMDYLPPSFWEWVQSGFKCNYTKFKLCLECLVYAGSGLPT